MAGALWGYDESKPGVRLVCRRGLDESRTYDCCRFTPPTRLVAASERRVQQGMRRSPVIFVDGADIGHRIAAGKLGVPVEEVEIRTAGVIEGRLVDLNAGSARRTIIRDEEPIV